MSWEDVYGFWYRYRTHWDTNEMRIYDRAYELAQQIVETPDNLMTGMALIDRCLEMAKMEHAL